MNIPDQISVILGNNSATRLHALSLYHLEAGHAAAIERLQASVCAAAGINPTLGIHFGFPKHLAETARKIDEAGAKLANHLSVTTPSRDPSKALPGR